LATKPQRTVRRAQETQRIVRALDGRLPVSEAGKELLRKAFPDHWAFLLGELALYSFMILVLTGIYLTMYFNPVMTEHAYEGSYGPLRGVLMSEAYASTLRITFDVRGGLLVRQIHHWAALIFLASIMVHLFRIFFTGAFRRPREGNWTIGVTLLALALYEGFCGYSLPDDLLSGTGLRTAYGIVLSIPVVGTYLTFFIVGGQWPSELVIPRLYIAHVLFVPGLIIALITVHIFLVVYLKHTQWGKKDRTNRNVVGKPMYPLYTAKSIGLFLTLFGVLAGMAALFQINPIFWWGPYHPELVSIDAQPDWYVGFLEGAMRMMPGLESNIGGHTFVWGVFIPGVILPTVMFLILYCYPYFERWVTGGGKEYHLCDRPRHAPTRTGIGAAFITVYAVLLFAGGQDVLAFVFRVPVSGITWGLRAGFFVLPPLVFWVTRRACLGLQAADRARLRYGDQTGELRLTDGRGYEEGRAAVGTETQRLMRARQLPRPVPLGRGRATFGDRLRRRLHAWYFPRLDLPGTEEEHRRISEIIEDPVEEQERKQSPRAFPPR
jgi:ubiquinol-cytochrome c reductase cytochrome b subunit